MQLVLATVMLLLAGPDGDLAKRFGAAIKCGPGDRDVLRSWCAVPKIGDGKLTLPKAPTTYFGLTMIVRPGDDIRKAALQQLSPSALHLGPDGARLTGIKPDNEDERKQILDAAMSTATVLKGEATAVQVPAGLAGYLDSQRAKPRHKIEGNTFTAEIPARIYQVGNVYVVIESAADGVYVNVYPIAPIERR